MIAGFFSSPVVAAFLASSAFAYLVLIGGGVGVFEAWKLSHDRAVEARVEKKINDDAEHISEKAIAARLAARKPGAFERLRNNYCANCNGKTLP